MQTLEERRREELKKYERPEYYGVMKPWRVAIITDWLAGHKKPDELECLDVGCGVAETRRIAGVLRYKRWRGCEVVESCRGDGIDIIGGAHSLPYRDGEFDVVLCCDVFEHILEEDVPAALSEIHRVAKRAILLGISQCPGRFHPTIKATKWWLTQIAENMPPRETQILYEDRIPEYKRPYIWVDVR